MVFRSACGVIAWGESHRCLDCPKHLSKQRTKSEFGLCAELRLRVYCCGLDADSSRDNTLRLFRSSHESFGFPRDVLSLCRSVFWVSLRRTLHLVSYLYIVCLHSGRVSCPPHNLVRSVVKLSPLYPSFLKNSDQLLSRFPALKLYGPLLPLLLF